MRRSAMRRMTASRTISIAEYRRRLPVPGFCSTSFMIRGLPTRLERRGLQARDGQNFRLGVARNAKCGGVHRCYIALLLQMCNLALDPPGLPVLLSTKRATVSARSSRISSAARCRSAAAPAGTQSCTCTNRFSFMQALNRRWRSALVIGRRFRVGFRPRGTLLITGTF